MADFKTKLTKYQNELADKFTSVSWYGQKTDLETIDNTSAIINYLTTKVTADKRPHYWRVTLNVYATVDNSEELADLGYTQVSEIAIDENLNTLVQYTKDVVVL
ncbi:hypothetical protein P793_015 [Leuconostoc phage P793]|uniref:Uncharacterized protein n=1 Tax=Leuconostoc phage P793 TaxID=1262522 RepID=M4I770_9CAUD|nr:hypothetical protein P793_015 [Leuconostoc phage P793]AFY98188.1 hypothetical protein P793_015 [Leuconostoc phage P793]